MVRYDAKTEVNLLVQKETQTRQRLRDSTLIIEKVSYANGEGLTTKMNYDEVVSYNFNGREFTKRKLDDKLILSFFVFGISDNTITLPEDQTTGLININGLPFSFEKKNDSILLRNQDGDLIDWKAAGYDIRAQKDNVNNNQSYQVSAQYIPDSTYQHTGTKNDTTSRGKNFNQNKTANFSKKIDKDTRYSNKQQRSSKLKSTVSYQFKENEGKASDDDNPTQITLTNWQQKFQQQQDMRVTPRLNNRTFKNDRNYEKPIVLENGAVGVMTPVGLKSEPKENNDYLIRRALIHAATTQTQTAQYYTNKLYVSHIDAGEYIKDNPKAQVSITREKDGAVSLSFNGNDSNQSLKELEDIYKQLYKTVDKKYKKK